MHRLVIILLIIFATIAGAADLSAAKPKAGRNAQSVKKERRIAAGEVERTRKEINQNSGETRRQLNKLASLNAEADRSSRLIEQLDGEIDRLSRDIALLDDTIASLEHNRSTLRSAYADNLRTMRDRRRSMSVMSMLFASSSFTEAYRRYRYLQEFELWRKDKVRQLTDISAEISVRRHHVDSIRNTQAAKLVSLKAENDRLQSNRKETEDLVAELKRKGSSLNKALEEKQAQLKKLDAELDRIIAEEARKAEAARKAEEQRLAEEAKKKAREAATNVKNKVPAEKPVATPQEKKAESESQAQIAAMTGSFESNKGRMPLPVTGRYSIVSHFGLNSHREVSNVKVNNSGIDIQTAPGSSARAVFAGEVSSVFHVNGYQNVVMLRHGNYLTVYAGLDKLAVKKGDKVKAGQELGTIYSDPDDDNRTVLHFEVRRERAKLNPEDWVK